MKKRPESSRPYPQKDSVNYLYFSIILLFNSAVVLARYFFLEGPFPWVFPFYALGQVFLEVLGLLLFAFLLKRWMPSWISFLFITFCLLSPLLHFTDFLMGRLLDSTLSNLMKFLFGFGIAHIATAFEACNMNGVMIATIIGSLLLLPLVSTYCYRLTERLSRKKPLFLSLTQIVFAFGSLSFFLLIFDFTVFPHISYVSYVQYQRTLPFGATLFSPPRSHIVLQQPLALPRNETLLLSHLPSFSLSSRPNLYLFIIETLRKDFITQKTAPHLTAFAEQNIAIPFSFSNATSSQLSWFAIFHADFPYHWTSMRTHWQQGSIPLQILKRLGYKIRVYTSADLHYFGMDELLFGRQSALVDQKEEYPYLQFPKACDRDCLALQSFERDIRSHDGKEGNLFVFFLDSTHSEYSFPDHFPAPFTPMLQKIDYLTFTHKEIEPLKNRYRNAIAFVDSLIGRFLATLRQENLYEEAIIAITGDHGEEFFEEGALFHGTHLNRFQTSVPLFFKFQKNAWPAKTQTATHIDLFPSILHYLTGENDLSAFVDGQSIFANDRWPYRIAVLQNGPDTPYEFALATQDASVAVRLPSPHDIYHQTDWEILALQTPGSNQDSFETLVQTHFPHLFDPLLKK